MSNCLLSTCNDLPTFKWYNNFMNTQHPHCIQYTWIYTIYFPPMIMNFWYMNWKQPAVFHATLSKPTHSTSPCKTTWIQSSKWLNADNLIFLQHIPEQQKTNHSETIHIIRALYLKQHYIYVETIYHCVGIAPKKTPFNCFRNNVNEHVRFQHYFLFLLRWVNYNAYSISCTIQLIFTNIAFSKVMGDISIFLHCLQIKYSNNIIQINTSVTQYIHKSTRSPNIWQKFTLTPQPKC